jgi:hypothetical protein
LQQVKLLDPQNPEVDGFLCFTTNCTKPPVVSIFDDSPFREWQTNDVPKASTTGYRAFMYMSGDPALDDDTRSFM